MSRSDKGPVTTQLPDWDELLSEYLNQAASLDVLIRQAKRTGDDISDLDDELETLKARMAAVEQMRDITARNRAA